MTYSCCTPEEHRGRTPRSCFVALAAFAQVAAAAPTTTPPATKGSAPEFEYICEGSTLSRAVYAEGRLWARADAGCVFSLGDKDPRRHTETMPGKALDLCVWHQHVAAFVGEPTGGPWMFYERVAGKWEKRTGFDSAGDVFVGLDCSADEIVAVTSRRIVTMRGSEVKSVALSGELSAGLTVAVLVTPEQVYIGVDHGEFGGGLRAIDRKTGAVRVVEQSDGQLCDGPLTADCDPVNAIAVEPWRNDCVVAAVGLQHMGMSHGRLVEVCGPEIKRLLVQPTECLPEIPKERLHPKLRNKQEPLESPFYGLVRVGDALVAAGNDALYKVTDGPTVMRTPFPAFKNIDWLSVCFERHDIVLIYTDINNRAAVSGAVPMLVPR